MLIKLYSVFNPLIFLRTEGVTNSIYRLFEKVVTQFQPDAFVIQCGADCLTADPLGGFNLTPDGMAKCIKIILEHAESKPCLFLGGGGYNRANTARYWANITAQIVSKSNSNQVTISNDIPDTPFFTIYGPSFELRIQKGLRMSENTDQEILSITEEALGKIMHPN